MVHVEFFNGRGVLQIDNQPQRLLHDFNGFLLVIYKLVHDLHVGNQLCNWRLHLSTDYINSLLKNTDLFLVNLILLELFLGHSFFLAYVLHDFLETLSCSQDHADLLVERQAKKVSEGGVQTVAVGVVEAIVDVYVLVYHQHHRVALLSFRRVDC